MASPKATLTVADQEISLPTYAGTLGPEVVDVSRVHTQELFTYDPGFMSTAACESKITYIDGDQGILLYRGYLIDGLAEKYDFMDVAYLLFNGELPDSTTKTIFTSAINNYLAVDPQLLSVFASFQPSAHPMGMLASALANLSATYQCNLNDAEARLQATYYLAAQMPILAAHCYLRSQEKTGGEPQTGLSYTANFMQMITGKAVNPVLVKALDKILILHADHEQNASTSTVRMVGSTGANPIAAITAGVCALWGPAHGGANEACLKMLQEIADPANISHYLARAKDKDDPFRLMGFGHRVYKNYDPRAKVMRATCHEVLDALDVNDAPLFKLAMELERIALEDPYFVERKLYPNVDFYSGLTLSALGIPANMFTVIFALARNIGWLAQWLELMADPNYKIARPRQLYTGAKVRSC